MEVRKYRLGRTTLCCRPLEEYSLATFGLAKRETNAAYRALVKFALEMLTENSIDLVAKVTLTFTDGFQGCHAVLAEFFSEARQRLCLEHGKKNIGKNSKKFFYGSKTRVVQNAMK